MLTRQLTQLVQQIPSYLSEGQELLLQLPERYPQLISEQQIQQIIASVGAEVGAVGQQLRSGITGAIGSYSGTGVFPVKRQAVVD